MTTNAYVSRWDGASWVPLGGSLLLSPGEVISEPAIAVDGSGTAFVALSESVRPGPPRLYLRH